MGQVYDSPDTGGWMSSSGCSRWFPIPKGCRVRSSQEMEFCIVKKLGRDSPTVILYSEMWNAHPCVNGEREFLNEYVGVSLHLPRVQTHGVLARAVVRVCGHDAQPASSCRWRS